MRRGARSSGRRRRHVSSPPVAPALPIPRVLDLAARREGAAVRVSWRTSIPARRAQFFLIGDTDSGYAGAFATLAGRGRTRFAVTLHSRHGLRIRTVALELTDPQLAGAVDAAARVR